MGMRPRRTQDGSGLRRAVRGMRWISDEAWAAVSDDGRRDPRQIVAALLEDRLVDATRLQRAIELHVRRRLFALYDLPAATRLRIREGIDRLADFWPAPIDMRPVIAFGTVARADPRRRAALMKRVLGRTVRLVAPYDARRNQHGLPPAVVSAVQALEDGRRMTPDDALPGLSPEQTVGVLLLLDRMALLKLD